MADQIVITENANYLAIEQVARDLGIIKRAVPLP